MLVCSQVGGNNHLSALMLFKLKWACVEPVFRAWKCVRLKNITKVCDFSLWSSVVVLCCCQVLLKPCCPQAEYAEVLQPVCTRPVFQPPDHPRDHPFCHYQHLSCTGGSKLDTATTCDRVNAARREIITPHDYWLKEPGMLFKVHATRVHWLRAMKQLLVKAPVCFLPSVNYSCTSLTTVGNNSMLYK